VRVNMVNMVRGFITAKPTLANCDVELIWAIWAWQLSTSKPSKNIKKLDAKELISLWKNGDIASPFNISRSRRKCQQHYPETRGESYVKKQKHQERIIKDVKRETDNANRVLSERSGEGSIEST
jgi:hypothetical protein